VGRGARTQQIRDASARAASSSADPFATPAALATAAPPYGGDLSIAGQHYFGSGGCAHLALAFHSLWPQLKLAAAWYDDHGRKALAHAVAWDPATGRAYDIFGAHVSPQDALGGWEGKTQLDVNPQELAEVMHITWSDDEPWSDGEVYKGSILIGEHFLGTRWDYDRECYVSVTWDDDSAAYVTCDDDTSQ
jgi:hypothetical protein